MKNKGGDVRYSNGTDAKVMVLMVRDPEMPKSITHSTVLVNNASRDGRGT